MSKDRIYCRVGLNPKDPKCRAFRVSPKVEITDEIYDELRSFISGELDQRVPDSGRRRNGQNDNVNVSVGFYFRRGGEKPLAASIQCWSGSFNQGGLHQDNLRIELDKAWVAARKELNLPPKIKAVKEKI